MYTIVYVAKRDERLCWATAKVPILLATTREKRTHHYTHGNDWLKMGAHLFSTTCL